MIASPVPGMTIIGLYLYFVNSWGPRYMKDRKPFVLKGTLIAYNFIQVMISVYLFTEVCPNNPTFPRVFHDINSKFSIILIYSGFERSLVKTLQLEMPTS